MIEKAQCFISAVVYVRNNEKTIYDFLDTITAFASSRFSHVEIICVDDASDDNSTSEIKRFASTQEELSLNVVHMGFFHGREIAMRAGDDLAIGDYLIEFDDAIAVFDPSVLSEAWSKVEDGYDIVSATPKKRKLSSKLFYRTINRSFAIVNNLDTETFRILSRRALNRIESSSHAAPYRKALYANSGLPQTSITYDQIEQNGRSQTKTHEKRYRLNLAVDALVLFTQTGYKIALGLSLFMMIVALFMIIYSFACYFVGITVTGWMTTILFISFAFFGLFGILAIIIKYLQIIVDLVFKKKPYTYESIEKLL